MLKFFTNTIQSNYIKALLSMTPLPIYKTIREGDYIVKGCYYIDKSSIVKSKVTGIFGDTTSGASQVDTITSYRFGNSYPLFTEKFISKYNYYDSKTHEFLGKYLRCLRDIYDVDLMPFYNCYSGRNNPNYSIVWDSESSKYIISDTALEDLKVYLIPIKFNKTYTIGLDNSSLIALAPVLLNNSKKLNLILSDGQDINSLLSRYIKTYNIASIKNAFTFKIDLGETNALGEPIFTEQLLKLLTLYEKDLNLFILVPAANNSSLVVLEGNYTYTLHAKTIDEEEVVTDYYLTSNHLPLRKIDYMGIEEGVVEGRDLDKICLNNLSLLSFNINARIPFANRLIEYLLQNVIDSLDEIPMNITRTLDLMGFFKDILNELSYKGVWDDFLRYKVYNYYLTHYKFSKDDIYGYVDSDTEKVLKGVE